MRTSTRRNAVRQALCILLVCAMLLPLCACGEKEAPNALTFYVAEEETWWTAAIENFRKKNEDVEIEVVSFKTTEELETRLVNELVSKKGPDVILWSALNSGVDMRRMAENGYFLDLNDYFEKDEDFKRERYYEPVLDCGKIGGRQYVVTSAFTYPVVMTAREYFENTGLADKTRVTARDFLGAVQSEADRGHGNDNTAAMASIERDSGLAGQMIFSDLVEIDYENKTVSADKDKVRELVDGYKTMQEERRHGNELLDNDLNWQMCAKNISFCYSDFSPTMLAYNFFYYYVETDTDVTVFGYTAYDDDSGYIARSALEMAVNKHSRNPELAYKFIRSAMDEQAPIIYEPEFVDEYGPYTVPFAAMPVMKGRLEYYLNVTFIEFVPRGRYVNDVCPKYVDIANNLSACRYWSESVDDIVSDAFVSYLDGTESFDTCYDRMMNQLKLYITE